MTEGQQKSTASKRPQERIYLVKESPNGGKAQWIEIGATWLHKDGKGHNIDLEAVPISGGKIVSRMIDWAKIDAGEPEPGPIADFDHADGI